MNTRDLIFFASGGLIGAFLMYFIINEKYKNESEESVQAVRDYYKRKAEEMQEETKQKVLKYCENDEAVVEEMVKTSGILDSIYSDCTDEEIIDEAPSEPVDAPILISEDTYVDTKPAYTKELLHYYFGDDVLTDEDFDPLINPEDLVGCDVRQYFLNIVDGKADYLTDNDAIYIRNDALSRDFEIDYHNDSFFWENDQR